MQKVCPSNWKHIMSFYDLSGGATLNRNIDAAEEIGLNVRGLVCDQGPVKMKFHSFLCQKTLFYLQI